MCNCNVCIKVKTYGARQCSGKENEIAFNHELKKIIKGAK